MTETLWVESVVRSPSLYGIEAHVLEGQSQPPSREHTLALLEHELRRAQYLAEPFALIAMRHERRLPPLVLSALRPIDIAYAYAPDVMLIGLVRARRMEVEAFAAPLLRDLPLGARVGAVIGTPASLSVEQIIDLAIDAATHATAGTLRIAGDAESFADDAPLVRAPNMHRLYELVSHAARTTIPVLVVGETGSGKESVARAVHDRSFRANAPFKAVNCAALPATLISSTLFGHERGAFTGANRQADGLFEQASGGTLFLDEVAELSSEAQAALLRVLETGTFVRVGGNKEINADVRLVAATHRDLAQLVAAGSFRADLLYRINAFVLRVPPLRERTEEIAALAHHFLAQSRSRWNAMASRVSAEALAALEAYSWPGNVRQLRNVVERAAAVCPGATIELEHLPEALAASPARSDSSEGTSSGPAPSLTERLRDLHAAAIREALESCDGNQSKAARLLGVPRRTFANRARVLGVLASRR